MKAVARIDEPLQAPLVVGQPLGAIVISLDDKPLEEIPLQALDAVDEGSLFSRLYDEFMLLFE
jgi:D-alanyl-D-alanine carboxypeptidase (penicillin-binding protein 5/6)